MALKKVSFHESFSRLSIVQTLRDLPSAFGLTKTVVGLINQSACRVEPEAELVIQFQLFVGHYSCIIFCIVAQVFIPRMTMQQYEKFSYRERYL